MLHTRAWKSVRWSRRCDMMHTWCLSGCKRPSWRAPNKPAAPGTVGPMDQSSLSNHCCHFLTPAQPAWHMSSKMASIQSLHLLLSSRVPHDVSRTHPKIFHWLHLPSPFRSFFSDMASLHSPVVSSRCAKTSFTTCMMQQQTL